MYMVMVDDSIDRGISLLETLGPLLLWDKYHHLLRGINDLSSPIGREPINNTSYMVVRSSVVLPLGGSMMKDE